MKKEIENFIDSLVEYEYTIYKQIYGVVLDEDISDLAFEQFNVISYKKNKIKIDKECNFIRDERFKPDENSYFVTTKIQSKDINKAKEIGNIELENFRRFLRVMVFNPLDIINIDFIQKQIYSDLTYCYGNGIVNTSSKTKEKYPKTIKLEKALVIDDMKNNYQSLIKILCSKNHTELQKRIIKSLTWLSDSYFEKELQIKFLKAVIALETLFTYSEKNYFINASIASQISESVAFLIGDDREERISIEKRIKNLYSIRSGINHSGDSKIEEKDYSDLCKYTTVVLIKLTMEDKFKVKSVKEFYDVIKTLKYEF